MSQIQQIKDASSIVEIVGERVALNRSGSHYRGLCPFHGEKSPSFFVNEELGIYKCFGCQAGGDVIDFVQKFENMTFIEALEYLADRAGIKLEKQNRPQSSAQDQLREEITSALEAASEYFIKILQHPVAGVPGREYLKKRNITAASQKLFQIGYVTESWDGLWRYLTRNKKIKPDIIMQAGLALRSNRQPNNYYDRFRGRLMFPLKNNRGQIVGFSGRKIAGDEKDAKYINSPETLVYHKSQLFYGLSENLAAIKKEQAVIVVEGELDAISSVQAYVDHVVAIKGSALTDDHAKLIKRYVNKVYLALDSDDAGLKATQRAAKALDKVNVDLRVIIMPEGKDPDELAQKNPQLWRETVKKSVSIYDFYINSLRQKFDLRTIEGKTNYLEALAPIFGEITNAVEYDYYLQKLANLLGVNQTSLDTDLKKMHQRYQLQKRTPSSSSSVPAALSEPVKTNPRIKKEHYLFFLLFNFPDAEKQQAALQSLLKTDFDWADPQLNALYLQLKNFKPQFSVEKFNQFLPAESQSQFTDLYLGKNLPSPTSDLEKIDFAAEFKSTLTDLKQEALRDQLQKLNLELEKLESKTDLTPAQEEKQETLLREIVKIQQQMKF